MLVKRVRCHVCGASKVKRPTTGYVYCDYCSALTDWDFEVAKSAPGAVLPKQYETLTQRLQPQIDAAKAAGDKGRYHALQTELYDEYTQLAPAGFPPRVRDPEYRERFVRYTASTCVVQDFDPGFPALAEAVTRTSSQLGWDMSGGTMRVTPDSFWAMWGAFVARIDRSMDLNEQSGLLAHHPDGATREMLRKMGLSAMVQAWLPYLDEQNRARLLAESGLGGDYIEAQPVQLDQRTCGECGGALEVPAGASRCLCDACGHVLEVGGAETSCDQCGKRLSWPAGKTILSCPACRNELRLLVNPYA